MPRYVAPLLVVVAFAAGFACTTATVAPPPPTPAPAPAAAAPAAPDEPLPTPIGATLLDGLGSYHRPITTASPDAQRWFDQGLMLSYGFNHDAAERSFLKATELDPDCAMCWWGAALVLGPHVNATMDPANNDKAWMRLQKARALAPRVDLWEQAYIEALSARYAEKPAADRASLDRAYANAMNALTRKLPDDVDAATLYAEALMDLSPWNYYTAEGKPRGNTPEIVRVLESVFARDPDHAGALHLYIHAVEASDKPERGAAAADRLRERVPGSGHLVHMPAHIYIRTGQYAKSAKSNADAAAVDEKYFTDTGANGFYAAMYYGHNLQFESAAAMFAGNLSQARAAAQRTVKLADPIADQMVMMEPFAAQELSVLVRFGQWPAILGIKAPPATRVLQSALFHFAHGAALAATGRVTQAEADLAALKSAVAKLPADAMVGPANSGADVGAVAIADLTARIAHAKGDVAAAINGFMAAAAAEDRLGYNEPPDWLNPERERLGAVLLKAGRFAEAERVFRADLARNTGNPRSLYGLYRALEGQKKYAAIETKGAFEKAWAGADVTLGDDLYGARR